MQGNTSIHLWWILRAFGRRNPLVRTIDRVELFVIALGILIALVATACAGALGTAVHEERSRTYLAEAQTRHTVMATAADDSTTVSATDRNAPGSQATRNWVTSVNARWQINGIQHTDGFTVDKPVKAGEPLTIWVDGKGNRVEAPTPTSQAGADAIGAAYAVWQTAVLAVIGSVCWTRSRLDRRRFAGWERDLRRLVYDGDGGNRKM
jgi:hypothetical protein